MGRQKHCMSTVLRGSTGCLGVPGRHPGSSGLPEGFLKAAKAWANLEQLVRVSLERNLGRVFQAEGTALGHHERGRPPSTNALLFPSLASVSSSREGDNNSSYFPWGRGIRELLGERPVAQRLAPSKSLGTSAMMGIQQRQARMPETQPHLKPYA